MKANTNDVIFDSIKYVFLIGLVLVTLLPFLNVLAVSLNDPMDTVLGGIGFWPRQFTFNNYADIFSDSRLWQYALNSVGRTVVAGFLHIFCNAMVAYTLTRRKYVFRVPVTFLFLLTMYIDAGLIPNYFLIKSLGLLNTFTVYWITGLTTAWNIIVIRTYMKGLPVSLMESAEIEGANDFFIFVRIILPLCLPVLATLILFTMVWHWNAWIDTFLYNAKNADLATLQYELMRRVLAASLSPQESRGLDPVTVTPKAIRAAMTIIVSAPIILIYPFFQRYFVQGLTIGGVKE